MDSGKDVLDADGVIDFDLDDKNQLTINNNRSSKPQIISNILSNKSNDNESRDENSHEDDTNENNSANETTGIKIATTTKKEEIESS